MDVIVKNFNKIKGNNIRLPIIIVYDRPVDYPQFCVARIFDVDKPTDMIMLKDNLEQLRKFKPNNMGIYNRSKDDDKRIVETWI
jgi:hypothetical protein